MFLDVTPTLEVLCASEVLKLTWIVVLLGVIVIVYAIKSSCLRKSLTAVWT